MDNYRETGKMFAEQSKLSADLLLSTMLPPTPNKGDIFQPSQLPSNDHQDTDREGDIPVSLVGRILLSSSFALSGITSKQATAAAISSQINLFKTDRECNDPRDGEVDDLLASVNSARREALSELREAALLFHAEAALAAL